MKDSKAALSAAVFALFAVCLVVLAQTTVAARSGGQQSEQRSKNAAAVKKALTDSHFTAILDKANANSARQMLMKYGAQSNIAVAVQRPAQFNFSGATTSWTARELPMQCDNWTVIHTYWTMQPPPGHETEVLGCTGYAVIGGGLGPE